MAGRNLTERQAKRCEEAREPACRCRCGGMLHGAKRGGSDAAMVFYNSLPEDDPHFASSQQQLKQRRREQAEAKRRERQARIDEADRRVQELRTALYAAQRDEQHELAVSLTQQFLEAYHYREEIARGGSSGRK